MFNKICVLKNFAKFTGKHLCWSLLLIQLQTFRPATLLKRDSNTGVFLEILQKFEERHFYRTHLGDCFCTLCSVNFLFLNFLYFFSSRKQNIIHENYNRLADNVFHNSCTFSFFSVAFDLMSLFKIILNHLFSSSDISRLTRVMS